MVMPLISKWSGNPFAIRQSTSPSRNGTDASGSKSASSSEFCNSSAIPEGTTNNEVPVSTTARHCPSSQKSKMVSPMRIRVIWTCQWPCSGKATGAHVKSPFTLSADTPPKEISETSSSLSAKNTPKLGWSNCVWLVITWKKLNSGAMAKLSKPRPNTPSKEKAWKGSWDISVAMTTLISTQCEGVGPASARMTELALSAAAARMEGTTGAESPRMPKQSRSCANCPVISPVP
mmetsp:Transcript_27207/g.78197  ORF Transcript_27207/g.78197 Transcript_27207/m.78197 type:complete len:233 (+) Transcript_27207:537-1235(+)